MDSIIQCARCHKPGGGRIWQIDAEEFRVCKSCDKDITAWFKVWLKCPPLTSPAAKRQRATGETK